MNRDDEIQSGKNRGKSGDENAQAGLDNARVGIIGTEGRVEGPAGVDAAGQHGVQHQNAADDVEIPAEEVNARESQILRADHHGHEEVAEHGGNGGNQEEEDHHHAVLREELVVSIGLHQVTDRREQFEADEEREESADEKEERDRDEVEQGNPLVVGGKQPRPDSVFLIEIIFALALGAVRNRHHFSSPDFLSLADPRQQFAPASPRRWT